MSTADEVIKSAEMATPATSKAPTGKLWTRIDDVLTRLGDYLNPILVKETRQALKSRQFTASFWLVLLFAAGWSFLGISILMPRVYYLPSGREMLTGYFVILCIPLLLVVPFSAFRSLATECEDGTYELLSITSLSARQIVTGKLGSAVLQMMVFYAALAPCIAFTYLLRGMDVGSIAILLVGTLMVSILFSCVGLVFAGMSRNRQWQALSSVLLILMLIVGGWIWGLWMMMLLQDGGGLLNQPEFWIGVGFIMSMYLTVVAMLILIAAAQNSFASDNRSTKLRITMLIQLVVYVGWMIFSWLYSGVEYFPMMILTYGAMTWVVYGAFLTGEVAELSPRARRNLPQSFFGRMFLTWFNPGSATGYVFIVGSFLALTVAVLFMNVVASAEKPAMAANINSLFPFAILLWSYMAFYLGLGRLVIVALRKVSDFGVTAVFLIHTLIFTFGAVAPWFIQTWLQNFRGTAQYNYLQVGNWVWSLYMAAGGVMMRARTSQTSIIITMSLAAVLMFCLNLIWAAQEIEATRLAAPERVRQDDDEVTASASTTG